MPSKSLFAIVPSYVMQTTKFICSSTQLCFQTFIFIYLVSRKSSTQSILFFCQFLHRKIFFRLVPIVQFSCLFAIFISLQISTYIYTSIHTEMSTSRWVYFYLFMMVLCVPFWLLFGLSNQLLNCVIWIIYDYSLENMELSFLRSFLFLTPMHCFFFLACSLSSSSPTYT